MANSFIYVHHAAGRLQEVGLSDMMARHLLRYDLTDKNHHVFVFLALLHHRMEIVVKL